MNDISEKNGFKVGTTAIIWAFATGMIAICIPLVAMTKSGIILPLTVILGATTSTVVIWRNDNQKAIESSRNLQHIEQRIQDLETICSRENFDARGKFKQLDKSIKT